MSVIAADCVPLDYGGPVDRPFEAFPPAALDGSIVDRFDAIVGRFPDRLAIRDLSASLTYRELGALVARIGAAVASAKHDRGGPIGILLGRDVRYPAAMLGVLAAGRAYAALDADHPVDRNRTIVVQADICAVVSVGTLAERLAATLPSHIPIIDIDKLAELSPPRRHVIRPAAADLAYIYFTSGSAGNPKGVPHVHHNMLHFMFQYTNALHLNSEDRLTSLHPPSSAAAARDIYAALLNGASLHILSPIDLGTAGLVRELRTRGITIYHSVPAVLRRVAEALATHERLDSVRIACLSSDRIEWHDVDACRRSFSHGVFVQVNLVGTETHLRCQWFVDDILRQTTSRPPVGRTVPDRELSIVDEGGEAVAESEAGEMLVKSRYIARGYWNAPDATAAAFERGVSDASLSVFRTGDICRRRPDGLIEFIGRKDQQIKLHGNRIEPGEIESALTALQEVSDAAVVVRRSDIGVPIAIVAYVVLRPGNSEPPRYLQVILAERLPRYMVPSELVLIDELPRLSNLKIDRRELNRMDTARVGIAGGANSDRSGGAPANLPLEPSNKIQEVLLGLWREVLERPDIGCDHDFFLCGGDSLRAADLLHRIENELPYQLPLMLVMEAPTVRQLEARLESGTLGRLSHVLRIHPAGRRRPLFAVSGLYGHAFRLVPVLRSLGPDQPCYALQPPGMDWSSVGRSTLPQIAAYYIGEIKGLQPDGPYHIFGSSFGGVIVFEMALQLQRMGESIEGLVMMDTIPPTCLVEGIVDTWQPDIVLEVGLEQANSVQAVNLGVARSHLQMLGEYVLDSGSEYDVFRGELTYIYCTGVPVAAGHDRRRLWQRLASRFRLLPLPGPHEDPNQEYQCTGLQNILRASLTGEPMTGVDPAMIFDRTFQLDTAENPEVIIGSIGDIYRIAQDRIQGYVDVVRLDAETIRIRGWAVEPYRQQPAQTIAVFLDRRFIGYGASGSARPDVAEYLNASSAKYAGFDFCFRCGTADGAIANPRVFVLSSGGRATELLYSSSQSFHAVTNFRP
jgi:amino acid adenylation domain-containing protein